MRVRFLTLCTFILLFSCNSRNTLFEKLESSSTGIDFNNTITETDSINIIDQENVYNGGGIAAGDFNNDGLQDLYFTGNLVSSKLYLNKGKMTFKDVSKEAGVEGEGRWARGVAAVDINNDGLLDIYVCATLRKKPEERENLLYVNQGIDKNGVPTFKEMAKAYGLADNGQSTMAAFFDYDNDGDLDCYIATNEIVEGDFPNRFRPILNDGSHANTDRLYRNDGNDSLLKHPVFTNVSKAAGILWEGYAHGLNICDINKDGWKDIYVSNDYLSGNILYINNRDGTFTNKIFEYFKHSSANAMGNDVIDVNNDGLSDVIELDMNPEDNYRKKMMMNPNSYQTYQNTDYFGYPYQYVRNSLQINQGNTVKLNDSIGDPVFAEVSFYSGIAQTDWSWTPSVADFDNDGKRDIIVSNGFPKDVTDHDFVAYRDEAFMVASKKQLLDQIPEVKISNYAYHNKGESKFENVSQDWGITEPSFTNGAVYVDLDNDGDLDYVANNINDKAFVYRNTTNDVEKTKADFLRVKLKGDAKNVNGIGAWVELYHDSSVQVYENSPYRGYLSTVDGIVHFGLGKGARIDSLVIKWPNNKKQVLKPAPNSLVTASIVEADQAYNWSSVVMDSSSYFREVSGLIDFTQKEKDFIDFNIQKLIPHKMSQYGPALAGGDINGDGLDDVIAGGAKQNSPVAMIQQRDGRFIEKKLISENEETGKSTEDMGLLLFDADGDRDLDLYVATGTYENLPNTPMHRDCFYLNDGKGNFKLDTTVFPINYTSKSCVKAADYDNDGDLDLFLGGRLWPGSWPKPVSSFIYRNDSKGGEVKFTDVTSQVAVSFKEMGLVCDAIWTDFDNDGWMDLVLAGEFMPISFIKNNKGVFSNVNAVSGIEKQIGWWNSLAAGDFDNDGDIDYVAGNLGQNSFYKATDQEPVTVLAKDFDKNGSYDAIPGVYLPDVMNGNRKEFPAQTRDDLIKQIIGFRQKFPGYKPFATATLQEMFTPEEMKDALVLKANYMQSAFVRNDGGGKFSLHPLPTIAQWSMINGMIVDDVDGDGNLDIIASTNDHGGEVTSGRYDALNGLLLKGDGNGKFSVSSVSRSGVYLPGDGKAMIKIMSANGNYLLLASQNKAAVKTWLKRENSKLVKLTDDDVMLEISLKNGKKRKQELYHGDSFLSQSSRFISPNSNMVKVEVTDNKKAKRTIQL